MNSLKPCEIQVSDNQKLLPPPSVNPATPTPGTRPPTTFTPVGSSAAYTWSQVSPAPTSTVPDMTLTFVSLKRVNAICTPLVDENFGFVACPPPFTAKGVRVDPKIRSYESGGRELLMRLIRILLALTILLTSSAEPGSTEQTDASELEADACDMSSRYSGVA